MYRLHDNASSGNAYKVRLMLTQLGLPFERIEYDTDHGATRTPEFVRARNPNGRIPVLELPDGRCLPESNAILWYLAEGTPFLPTADGEDGRWQRAQVLQWLFFEQYSHEPHIATVRHWLTHGLEMTPERTAGRCRASASGARPRSPSWSSTCACAGSSSTSATTIADIALYAYTHVAPEGGF